MTCARDGCDKESSVIVDGLDFCSPQCAQKFFIKLTDQFYDDIDEEIVTYEREFVPIPPLPPLIEEGVVVCARCSSKLPRDNKEMWRLTPDGYICQKVKCQT